MLADEGTMKTVLFQLEGFYNTFARELSKNKKKWGFRFYFLQTT